jgi:hypothetical protein
MLGLGGLEAVGVGADLHQDAFEVEPVPRTEICPDNSCLGRYAFTRPAAPGLRQLRDPHTDDEDDDGEQD